MTSDLHLFEDDESGPAAEPRKVALTPAQRSEIRELFAVLGIGGAREQFAAVRELTSMQISNPTELDAASAQRLIIGLRRRIDTASKTLTGNAWDDRAEATWIDRL